MNYSNLDMFAQNHLMLGMLPSSSPAQENTSYNNSTNSSNIYSHMSHLSIDSGIDLLGCEDSQTEASNYTSQKVLHNLVNMRRGSGFGHNSQPISLDELSLGIMSMSSQDREENISYSNTSYSFPPTSSTPMPCSPVSHSSPASSPPSLMTSAMIRPTGNEGVEYVLASQHDLFMQQQQQLQSPPSFDQDYQGSFQAHQQQQQQAIRTWSMGMSIPEGATMKASEGYFEHQGPGLYQDSNDMMTMNTLFASPLVHSPPLQYHPRQGQIQRPKQRKPSLQVMTPTSLSPTSSGPLDSARSFAYPAPPSTTLTTSGYSTSNVHWDMGAGMEMASPQANPEMGAPTVSVSSPSTAYSNNNVPHHQNYPWGMVSSPVESCFSSSGTSTPMFASPSSCESSRAASPSFSHSNLYDGYLSERRLKRLDSESLSSSISSSLIIRSRKSSTSSTSSIGSQRRMSTLRESSTCASPNSSATVSAATPSSSTSQSNCSSNITTSSPTHQCPKCGQCFAGPAVLVRHIESIHDKLLWNCVGCKSNLSRRDAVTRHINLSPMDSICRSVGTIGQVKTNNGAEVHYEISPYRAKPLDEVMSRMGKKISTALRKEIDRSKAVAAVAAASVPGTTSAPTMGSTTTATNQMMFGGYSTTEEGAEFLVDADAEVL